MSVVRLALGFVALVMIAAGCSGESGATGAVADPAAAAAARADAAASTPTTTLETGPLNPIDIAGAPVNQFDLENGECFNQVEDIRAGRKVVITSLLPCDEPHLYEVFHVFAFEAPHPAIYPGDDVMEDFAFQGCYAEFASFVGELYELSVFDIGVFTPNRTNFEDDRARYRGIHCWLRHVDGIPVEGSAGGVGT